MKISILRIILGLIGLLAGLVLFLLVYTSCYPRYYGDPQPYSRMKIEISSIETAIELYKRDNKGKLPASLQDLVIKPKDMRSPYLTASKEFPKDPWGNDYIYKVIDKNTCIIICYDKYGVEVGKSGTKVIPQEKLKEFQ